ncbi:MULTISPECIES: dipeptidase [Bizionia]|uniref:Membrane dipeptidase n=1 Tax=Bizionia algoritergicola TaxID=291187 RepID=A0A5D0QWL2_9FLAO|nr:MULTISPECIES: dipeptidase [Bizionia]OBX24033.1 peptidase M19 [Bizionia sp. APA-3]TYB73542.1 membrane dipeptidase [Bizionia algoritergicola]
MKSIKLLCLFFLLIMSCKDKPKQEETLEIVNEEVVVTPEMMERAKGIHERVITLDTHDDFNVNNFTDSINYTQDLKSQVTLPKMKAGGLDVAWFIVYTGQDTLTSEGYTKAYETAMGKFDAIHKLVTDIAPDQIELALTSDDVRRINTSGKKIAMIGIENGYPVGTDIKNVEKFYNLGGRYMSLAHNGHSQLSDSNTGEKDNVWLHNGLSPLGKEVIVEMNRLGMMIDVSHPSKEAMRQMIELTKAPIIASHSSARALCDHSRNLDDEQLQWMKDNNGVVQTVALDAYVNAEKVETRDEALKSIQKEAADSLGVKWYTSREEVMALSNEDQGKFFEYYGDVVRLANEKAETIEGFPPAVNVADFVDHIDYMVDKIGINHVGISSDFDGGGGIEGWRDASETFNVTLELVKRGYTEAEISKLWSENLLRVLDDVQAVAKDMQAQSNS